jgi:hypothetical protein
VIDSIATLRANILDIHHDRLAADLSFGKAKVIFTVEVRGRKHLETIFADLSDRGYSVRERK